MALTQAHFRFGSDSGTGDSDYTFIANQDANPTCGLSQTIQLDTTFLLRYVVFASANHNNIDWTYQYALNGGTWTAITTTSTVVKAVNSVLTGGNNCVQRLTGQGEFEATGAGQSENGTAGGGANDIASGGCSETVCSMQIISGSVSHGDVLTFRLLQEGAVLDTYSVTPTLTLNLLAAKTSGETLAPVITEAQSIQGTATVTGQDVLGVQIVEASSLMITLTSDDDEVALGGVEGATANYLQAKIYEGVTLIATFAPGLTTSLAALTYTLTATEKAAITDYGAPLSLTLVANGRQSEVAWFALQTPAAAATAKSGADTIALGVEEASSLSLSVVSDDAVAVALDEALSGTATEDISDTIALGVADGMTGVVSAALVDAISAVIEEALAGTGTATVDEALAAVLAESGTKTEAGESFTLALYQGAVLVRSWDVPLTTDLTLLTDALSDEQKAGLTAEGLTNLRYVLTANERQVMVGWADLRLPVSSGAATPKSSSDVIALALEDGASSVGTLTSDDVVEVAGVEAHSVLGTLAEAEVIPLGIEDAATSLPVLSSSDLIAIEVVEDANIIGDYETTAANEDLSLVVAEAATLTGTLLSEETLVPALQESFAGTATGDLLDTLVAYLVENQNAVDLAAVADKTSADLIESVLAEAFSGTGSIVHGEAIDAVLTEIASGASDISVADFCAAVVTDAMSGTATIDASDACIAALVDALVGGDLASATSSEAIAAVIEETVSLEQFSTLSSAEVVAVGIAEALTGAGLIAQNELVVPVLVEAITGAGLLTSPDELAAVISEAYTLTFGLTTVEGSDTLEIGVAETATPVAALAVSDVLVALLQDERLSGTATITVTTDIVGVLQEAMLGDGAISAADSIDGVLAEALSGLAVIDDEDALAVVLVARGTATAIVPLSPFSVGTLVVTWPAYSLVSQFADYELVNRTDGWPYTLVQKV